MLTKVLLLVFVLATVLIILAQDASIDASAADLTGASDFSIQMEPEFLSESAETPLVGGSDPADALDDDPNVVVDDEPKDGEGIEPIYDESAASASDEEYVGPWAQIFTLSSMTPA